MAVEGCNAHRGIWIGEDNHDAAVEVVEVADGGFRGSRGMRVDGADYGEVDGQHMRRELGEAAAGHSEGRYEEALNGEDAPPDPAAEEKNKLVRMPFTSEAEQRLQQRLSDGDLQHRAPCMVVGRQVNKVIATDDIR